jgi:azurin
MQTMDDVRTIRTQNNNFLKESVAQISLDLIIAFPSLFTQTIVVYAENNTKQINTDSVHVCAECRAFNVKAGDTCSYHRPLKG